MAHECGQLLAEYSLGAVLGQGAFGIVYACKKKGTNEEFAVKLIDKVESIPEDIKRETEMQAKLDHPTIVRLHKVYHEKVFVCMVLDLYRGGDVIEAMQAYWGIPPQSSRHISRQMVEAIKWLHSQRVVHRDVKGDNFIMDRSNIVDPDCRVLLSDFGTVTVVKPGEKLTRQCGTQSFWAPEFYNKCYGLKVDIWALGVLQYGLLSGRFPFKNEKDVKTKTVKFKPNIPEICQEFCQIMLTREEDKRPEPQKLLDHAWMRGTEVPAALKAVLQPDQAKEEETHNDPANNDPKFQEHGPHSGIKTRRQELVERLKSAHRINDGQAAKENDNHLKGSFSIASPGRMIYYEWWPLAKVEQHGILQNLGTPLNDERADDMTEQQVERTLADHQVDISKFGVAQAKTKKEFAQEIMAGEAQLMLDAEKYKKVVRVLDVVLLRIVLWDGKGARLYLVNTSEEAEDGRRRNLAPGAMLGAEKNPWENNRETVERVLVSRLHLQVRYANIEAHKCEFFEESEDAPAFPGVKTVYRKYIVPVKLNITDPKQLEKLGMTSAQKSFVVTDAKKWSRTYQWMTENECQEKGIRLTAPVAGADVSALVCPPMGFDEEQLKRYFEMHNWDQSNFGQGTNRTLREFAEELVTGEAQITQESGKLKRIVDVVILKVSKPDGTLLIETSESVQGGAKQTLNRLPAVKRRPLENQFLAAKRVLTDIVNIHSEIVHLSTEGIKFSTHTQDSIAYAGLRTEYRKRVINASVLGV
eukprot:CAMPEP_0178389914 /NCGR_PEP_ID=MMETSP0689_2-20121128/10373_1 /TAXON_ID=160604 /ORGANISM="Amphidinium massartii, Strain CS-259" /LENGTH=753 /DNA_ID=CAMNT_0020010401 /DNA_START=79 /DNA_END=2340 /DNA_ORIENTATION=+